MRSITKVNVNILHAMIDLNKLDKEIDELFENETESSLTSWLMNKRFGSFEKLVGNGKFVAMQKKSTAIKSFTNKANFNQTESTTDDKPINRHAA